MFKNSLFYRDQLNKLSTTVLFDKSYNNCFILDENLCNFLPNSIMCGEALVVEVENSILPIIQAIDIAKEGQVLVILDKGNNRTALLGDIVMTAIKEQGIEGLVVFGMIRDIGSIANIKLPVWSQGVSIVASTLGSACCKLPTSIKIDSGVINNNDWIVGDGDGLICIPAEHMRFILKSAQIKDKKEKIYIEKLKNGERISTMMNLKKHLENNEPIVVDF